MKMNRDHLVEIISPPRKALFFCIPRLGLLELQTALSRVNSGQRMYSKSALDNRLNNAPPQLMNSLTETCRKSYKPMMNVLDMNDGLQVLGKFSQKLLNRKIHMR